MRKKEFKSKCNFCSKTYLAWHKSSKYCSWKCRDLVRINPNRHYYKRVYTPTHPSTLGRKDKSVYVHVLVMEKAIGRFLTKNEVVHHVDEDKQNNNLKNLVLFSNRKAHFKWHGLFLKQQHLVLSAEYIKDNHVLYGKENLDFNM